jgi:hypothetical protein
MKNLAVSSRARLSFLLIVITLVATGIGRAGVTFITHGLNGDADGWVTGMADRIPNYHGFVGTNFTCYKAYFYPDGINYILTATRVSGSQPSSPESGEILVKFDWSQLADGNSYNTYEVASMAAAAMLNTNFISELGGHALVEFPLHLIGHSRGGSLVCELSRQLGTNGVWVDHVSTLDPHPLNAPQFPLDGFAYSDVDAPARTYANVLFHDNYWQNSSYPVSGLSVSGAYTRQLIDFSGGYDEAAHQHSDVHLWYHGTIDHRVPADDTEAQLGGAQRTTWWNAYEAQGVQAGFIYSRIGGGNRLSTDRPEGGSFPMIKSGYNQNWDFGAGQSVNRTALSTNNGNWPSLIQINRLQTNAVTQGMSTDARFFYQWVGAATNGNISFYLDTDFNPLNTNQTLLKEIPISGTGTPGFVGSATVSVPFTNAMPGTYWMLGVITANGRIRYLYAPESVLVVGAPSLDITQTGPTELQIGINGAAGQTIVLQQSSDLIQWLAVSTNTLSSDRLVLTNTVAIDADSHFFRAWLVP